MRRWVLLVGALAACRAAATATVSSGDEARPAAGTQAPGSAERAAAEPRHAIEPAASAEVVNERDRAASTSAVPPEGWPSELPWVSDAELAHAYVETSEAGDVRVEWTTPSARVVEVGPRLQEGLAAAGYVPVEPCTWGGDGRCRLRLGDRLAVLWAGMPYPGSESAQVVLHLLPAGHQPLARLPGKCVVPPSRSRMVLVSAEGVDQDGEYRQAASRWAVQTAPGPDLDGDGVPEVYVPRASKEPCPWNVPHDVYVMRGSCGHRVGTIVGLPDHPTALAPFVRGLRTIHTTAEWAAYDGDFGVPNHHTRQRRYRFGGSTLRLESDEEREGKCHHCGVVRCEPEPAPAAP